MSEMKTARSKRLAYNATLSKRIDLSDKLAIFRVQPDAAETFPEGKIPSFDPGQYAVLGLNNELEPDLGKTVRAYSIASPPESNAHLDFYVRYVDQPVSKNPLTHMLWRLEENDRLHIGPKLRGKFTIEETVGVEDPRVKILVGAGTGLAPFYCLAASRFADGNCGERIAVLHGASYTSDLGYRDELIELDRKNPSLSYLATISRPNENPGWTGDVGRVESYFEPDRVRDLEERLGLGERGLNPDNAVIYICGLVGTIYSTLRHCLRLGFVPENRRIKKALGLENETPSLFYEQYDSTPVVDVKDPAAIEEILQGTPFEGRAVSEPSK